MIDFTNKRSGLKYGYFELLDAIDAELVIPTETGFDSLFEPSNKRRYWIRHDVDNHLHLAWAMAEAERGRGIKSVYFMLNTSPYFRLNLFISIVKDFVKVGHTIGMHNNSVTAAYKGGNPNLADEILQRDLDYLRNAGPIFITASHGDICNRQLNVMNYEMFTECRRNGSFPHRPLSDYGLKYEAYFLPRDLYLSDSGGVWSSKRDINISLKPDEKAPGIDPMIVIEKFNAMESGILQVLVHPQWWEPKQ